MAAGYVEVRLAVRDLHLDGEHSGQYFFFWERPDPRPSRPAHALIDWLEVGAVASVHPDAMPAQV